MRLIGLEDGIYWLKKLRIIRIEDGVNGARR